MADLCIHEVARCTICHEPASVDVRDLGSRPFVARHDGECAGCGFSIRVGDRVRFAHGSRLYHADHRRCAHG